MPLPYWLALISCDRLVHGAGPQTDEHRAEHLLAVDLHVGGDSVEDGRADEEAFLAARTGRPRPSTASRGALRLAGGDQAAIRSRAAPVMTGPISLSASRPGPTLTARGLLGEASTSSSPSRADRDRRGDRHAPLAGRAERRGDEVVGGEVEVGVGQDDRVVLGAAERLDPLAVAVARLVDVPAIGVEPTNDTAATSGWSSSASTASLSPCTTLKTPSGRPASATARRSSSDAEGSRSLGLSTKVLPQAIATGNIHIGTIAGKLNGVMPATHARAAGGTSRCRRRWRPGRSIRP